MDLCGKKNVTNMIYDICRVLNSMKHLKTDKEKRQKAAQIDFFSVC